MTEFIQVSTTTDSEQAAEHIAAALVEQRLAACAQVSGPIRSVYRWQDEVQQSQEWLCTAKTRGALYPQVETAIHALHAYECPEILATPIVDGSASYLTWLGDQL